MKFSSFALLALTALEKSDSVYSYSLIASKASRPVGSQSVGVRTLAVNMSTENDIDTLTDVSIPYDSAAELAYKGWIDKYNKPYDSTRYEVFVSNYKAITVMNISAKKEARDDGTSNPSLLSLNEFADCTAEEYEAATKKDTEGGSVQSIDDNDDSENEASSTTGNILGDTMKAVQQQSAASSALQDAADALKEEEEVSSMFFYSCCYVAKFSLLIVTLNLTHI